MHGPVFFGSSHVCFSHSKYLIYSEPGPPKIGFVMLGFLVLAYLNDAFLPLSVPMSINVCLYSCPLFFIGFMFKNVKFLSQNKILNYQFPQDFMNCKNILWDDGDHLSSFGEETISKRLPEDFLRY